MQSEGWTDEAASGSRRAEIRRGALRRVRALAPLLAQGRGIRDVSACRCWQSSRELSSRRDLAQQELRQSSLPEEAPAVIGELQREREYWNVRGPWKRQRGSV